MKLEDYKKMTDEERLNLINELEDEEKISCKGLEKFLNIGKNNETKDKEKWICFNGVNGECAVRVSDIEYMEENFNITEIVTKKVKDGKNVILKSQESPSSIIRMMEE